MTFDEYQAKSKTTALYPQVEGKGWVYPALGLTSEAGEVASKFKKAIRDRGGKIDDAYKAEIGKELGDVLWYVAQLASELGLSLDQVASGNIDKLFSRRDRDQLKGSGDNR